MQCPQGNDPGLKAKAVCRYLSYIYSQWWLTWTSRNRIMGCSVPRGLKFTLPQKTQPTFHIHVHFHMHSAQFLSFCEVESKQLFTRTLEKSSSLCVSILISLQMARVLHLQYLLTEVPCHLHLQLNPTLVIVLDWSPCHLLPWGLSRFSPSCTWNYSSGLWHAQLYSHALSLSHQQA